MKKACFISFLSILLTLGCTSNKEKYESINTDKFSIQDFNQERYVWEGMYFPTNRVMDRK